MDDNFLNKLKKAMLGQEAPIQIPMAPEQAPEALEEAQIGAETAQINEQAKSPNMMTKPELVQKEVQEQNELTVPGQLQERSVASEGTSSNKIVSEPEKNPLQELLRKRNEIEIQKNKEIKEARSSDSNKAMLANAIKALGTIGQAEVQRNAKTNAGIKSFTPVKGPNTAGQLEKDRERLLNKLKEDYQILQSGKKEDKISALDQAKLDQNKRAMELKEKMFNLKANKTPTKGKSKLEEEREKDLAERFTTLEEQVPNRLSTIDEAKVLIEELEKGNIGTGPGSALAGSIGSFFGTEESSLKERLDSLAEKAARAQLKANGETRPTDADVEGMKKAMFNLSNTKKTNVGKLKEFIKQQESGLDEYNQMKTKLDNGEGLEDFKLKPTYKSKDVTNEVKRRTKDGQVAVFDKDTKKFLRYEN